eukprot:1157727-Pelagomonas_calceolata.AAC.16
MVSSCILRWRHANKSAMGSGHAPKHKVTPSGRRHPQLLGEPSWKLTGCLTCNHCKACSSLCTQSRHQCAHKVSTCCTCKACSSMHAQSGQQHAHKTGISCNSMHAAQRAHKASSAATAKHADLCAHKRASAVTQNVAAHCAHSAGISCCPSWF